MAGNAIVQSRLLTNSEWLERDDSRRPPRQVKPLTRRVLMAPIPSGSMSVRPRVPRAITAGGLGLVLAACGGPPTTPGVDLPMADEPVMEPTSAATDREALEALYHATEGDNWWNRSGWLSSLPLGEWHGVETDADGRVTHLSLGGNGLRGPIPSGLGQLTGLKELRLDHDPYACYLPECPGPPLYPFAYNYLSGEIPAELGDLVNLEHVSLRGNELSGAIPPELGRLTNLTNLSLTDNGLSGEIPAELGKLANLRTLSLAANLLSGPIPAELGQLTNLGLLDLRGNPALVGPIPRELTNLTRLSWLMLPEHVCVPSGAPFDAWFENLHRPGTWRCVPANVDPELRAADRAALEAFYQSTGGDQWLENWGWLTEEPVERWHGVATGPAGRVTRLHLHLNLLDGNVPAEIGQLAGLESLVLSDNFLEGPIPPELGQLSKLEGLRLANNALLSGPLPDTFLSLTRLQELELGGTGVCVPAGPAFDAWLSSIGEDTAALPRCLDLADRVALEASYRAADGDNRGRNAGWLSATDATRYGVRTDASGLAR